MWYDWIRKVLKREFEHLLSIIWELEFFANYRVDHADRWLIGENQYCAGTNGFADGDGERQRGTASRTSAIPGLDSGTVNATRTRIGAAASAVWPAPHPGATWRSGEGTAWRCGPSHHAVASGHAARHAARLGIATAVAASPRRPGFPRCTWSPRPRRYSAAAAATVGVGAGGNASGHRWYGLADAVVEARAVGPKAPLPSRANPGNPSRAVVGNVRAPSFPGAATFAATHQTHWWVPE